MRILSTLILPTILSLSLCSLGLAQGLVPTAAPSISCVQPVFEFGSRSNTESVKHTFTVSNKGTKVLNISGVKPACGCTIANISSKVLQPGESATIDATLSLKGRRGLQTKTITINSDDPKTPAYKLTMKGTAASEVGLNPTSIYVGRIGLGEKITKSVEVTNNGTNPLEIVSVAVQNNLVTYEVETVEEGKKYKVNVTTSAFIPVGRISEYLTITTNNEKAKTERITVFGEVVAKLSISPTTITLDPNAAAADQVIAIKGGSVKNFQIMDVVWDGPIRVVNHGINGFTVTLKGIGPSTGADGKKVVIKTNVPDLETIEVPVALKAAPAPGGVVPAAP